MDDSSRNSLALLGRGGAHCIYRYRGADPRLAHCVLRVPRAASSAAAGAEFVERTLRPLLGAQYLPPPVATLQLDAAVARALCADAPDAASLARAARRWRRGGRQRRRRRRRGGAGRARPHAARARRRRADALRRAQAEERRAAGRSAARRCAAGPLPPLRRDPRQGGGGRPAVRRRGDAVLPARALWRARAGGAGSGARAAARRAAQQFARLRARRARLRRRVRRRAGGFARRAAALVWRRR